MDLKTAFQILLLILLIVCAICVNLTPNLFQAVVIFMSYSSIMCIIWVLMESPDLAITEAAVGAGISGTLFLMTLKKIRAEDAGDDVLAGEECMERGSAAKAAGGALTENSAAEGSGSAQQAEAGSTATEKNVKEAGANSSAADRKEADHE